jgi:DNA-binding NarL/FixJ family response regulator
LIRLALVSPNPALRLGLGEILAGSPELSVLGAAARLEELEAPEEIDMLLVASIPETELRNLPAQVTVLLLTARPEAARVLAGTAGRAWGILPLDASTDEILAAVRALGEGLWVGAPAMLRDLFQRPSVIELSNPGTAIEPVTVREMDVLQSIARGLSNKQIALELGISEHTVKFHLSALYAKLGATNRTEAVRIGTQRGLIVL